MWHKSLIENVKYIKKYFKYININIPSRLYSPKG